jgi:hypothetical protein
LLLYLSKCTTEVQWIRKNYFEDKVTNQTEKIAGICCKQNKTALRPDKLQLMVRVSVILCCE